MVDVWPGCKRLIALDRDTRWTLWFALRTSAAPAEGREVWRMCSGGDAPGSRTTPETGSTLDAGPSVRFHPRVFQEWVVAADRVGRADVAEGQLPSGKRVHVHVGDWPYRLHGRVRHWRAAWRRYTRVTVTCALPSDVVKVSSVIAWGKASPLTGSASRSSRRNSPLLPKVRCTRPSPAGSPRGTRRPRLSARSPSADQLDGGEDGVTFTCHQRGANPGALRTSVVSWRISRAPRILTAGSASLSACRGGTVIFLPPTLNAEQSAAWETFRTVIGL